MPFDPHPEYLTIEQAAAYLNVTPAVIRRLLRQHGLGDFVRASISRQVLIRRADLDAIDLTQLTVRSAAARTSSRRRSGAA
jgi:excisionase family DNA binding protein